MNGEIEFGMCEVCGKEKAQLQRTYFRYDIKCECHSPNHFSLVIHCKDCVAVESEETHIRMKVKTNTLNKIGDYQVYQMPESTWVETIECPKCKSKNIKWHLSSTKECKDCKEVFRAEELI